MDVDANWYETFFDGDWLDILVPSYAAKDPERGERMVDFVIDKLALEPGARVLDLACGHGRHAIPLARRGFRVTGLDLSARSLELARAAATEAAVEVEWVHADMRDPPPGPYDAVVNLYSAFGYFAEEEENQRVVDAIARSLAPGGRFLIDTVNAHALVRVYQERTWEEQADGTLFLHAAQFDHVRGRNTARWTLVRPDGTRTHLDHDLRIYALHELVRMFERAGLELDAYWGGWDGSELTFESWRLIATARRPPE